MAMVLTGSVTAAEEDPATKAWRAPPELPHDVVVEIAGHVAASSPRPMDDIRSLRASSRSMRAACGERAVASRVALDREAATMRWSDADRYRAVVDRLARAGNPEACFLAGLTLVFADRRVHPGAWHLTRAAAAGHRAAAYVLGLLLYRDDREAAAAYIRQVEGEADKNDAAAPKKRTRISNIECERCRVQAVEAVREVTWNVFPVPLLGKEGHRRCTAAGCGAPLGWSNCLVFCGEECRIRHEYAQFFSMVPLPV